MIGLVKESARQKIFARHLELFTLLVLRADGDALAAPHLFAEAGDAQASLFSGLPTFRLEDFGIDDDDLFGFAFAVGAIDDGDFLGDADLRGGEPDAFRSIHGFEHIGDQLMQFGRIEFGNVGGFALEDRIAIFDYRIDHQKFFTCSLYASQLRRVSARESPPNFSRNACARTIAAIASPITPAAGTTHTSERS